jgi:FixJ family two-component response regulator
MRIAVSPCSVRQPVAVVERFRSALGAEVYGIGLDVLAALHHARWHTPVIMITAFGDEAIHHKAHHLGATDVLDKPFALDTLLTVVRRLALR